MSTNSQSDSDAPARSVSSRSPSASGAVAKPPGAHIRYDTCSFSFSKTNHHPPPPPPLTARANSRSRRAGASQVAKPNSTRAAGAGGSSNTMLKLYTDDSPGLRVYVFLNPPFRHPRQPCRYCLHSDPFIVLVLSLSFIASIFFLHISAKIIRAFT